MIRGNFRFARFETTISVDLSRGVSPLVVESLHIYKIDDALEICFLPDRYLDRDGIRIQAVSQRRNRVLEVGADTVHLVNEYNARNSMLVGLSPNRQRLRLHTGDRIEDNGYAVEHA